MVENYLWHSITDYFSQVKIEGVCPIELRSICEKGLLLLTITVPEMEVYQFVNFIFFWKCFFRFPLIVIKWKIRKNNFLMISIFSVACSVAFSVEDDYPPGLYWCCCNCKFKVYNFISYIFCVWKLFQHVNIICSFLYMTGVYIWVFAWVQSFLFPSRNEWILNFCMHLIRLVLSFWQNLLNNWNALVPFQVCRCISELCRHRSSNSNALLSECKSRTDIPNPEVLNLYWCWSCVYSHLIVLI